MSKIKLAFIFALLASFSVDAVADDGAAVNAMKMRAWYRRDVDNIFLLYGDKLPVTMECYEVAISNYVEEKWASFEKSYGTASGTDTKKSWPVLGAMYRLLRQFQYALDPEDEVNGFASKRETIAEIERKAQPLTSQQKQNLEEELEHYVGNCHTLKPVAWTVPGNALTEGGSLTAVSIKLSLDALLTGYLVARQLPAENKGYIGCLYVWNEAERSRNLCKDKACADDVPMDDRNALTEKLEELRTQGCGLDSALQMISPAAAAVPVK
jgi:hypothetical protein